MTKLNEANDRLKSSIRRAVATLDLANIELSFVTVSSAPKLKHLVAREINTDKTHRKITADAVIKNSIF